MVYYSNNNGEICKRPRRAQKGGSLMSRTENQMPLPKGSYILITLITAYLMFFSVVTNEITAFIAIALVVAFFSLFLRSRLLSLAVGVPAVLGFLSSSSFTQTASIVAAICIIGMGAVALLHVNKLLVGVCFAAALKIRVWK